MGDLGLHLYISLCFESMLPVQDHHIFSHMWYQHVFLYVCVPVSTTLSPSPSLLSLLCLLPRPPNQKKNPLSLSFPSIPVYDHYSLTFLLCTRYPIFRIQISVGKLKLLQFSLTWEWYFPFFHHLRTSFSLLWLTWKLILNRIHFNWRIRKGASASTKMVL